MARVLPRDKDGKLPEMLGDFVVIYITKEGLEICAICANRSDAEDDPVKSFETTDFSEEFVCEDCEETIVEGENEDATV